MIRKRTQKSTYLDKNRYLLTYADLISLLLGFFIILFAFSKLDKEKFDSYQEAAKKYFRSSKPIDNKLSGIVAPEIPNMELNGKDIDNLYNKFNFVLEDYLDSELLFLRRTNDELILELPEKLIFASGSAKLNTEVYSLLDSIAFLLQKVEKIIHIDGHTDSDPINNYMFRSNWDLSMNRASNIAHYLIQKGIEEDFLILRAYGAIKPKVKNDSKDNKSKNRRVEIVLKDLDISLPSKKGYEDN